MCVYEDGGWRQGGRTLISQCHMSPTAQQQAHPSVLMQMQASTCWDVKGGGRSVCNPPCFLHREPLPEVHGESN